MITTNVRVDMGRDCHTIKDSLATCHATTRFHSKKGICKYLCTFKYKVHKSTTRIECKRVSRLTIIYLLVQIRINLN